MTSGADTDTLPPLALYVHYPWCVQKCPYCDFNSHRLPVATSGQEATDAEALSEQYLQALLVDLEHDLSLVQGRKITSLFFGGGTPSLFAPRAVATLLDKMEQKIGFVSNAEITLEANPGTADQDYFVAYRQAGVNRLSLGVQSFCDDNLKVLGRIHNGAQAQAAYRSARQAGFDNINLDLMFALPEQSPAKAMADLQQACDLGPEHISWYELTIEPNTVFYSQPPVQPEDEAVLATMAAGQALLDEHGFGRYEISAYAQPTKQSRHNLNYWQFGDYLGLGAGAHSKITQRQSDGERRVQRFAKVRQPEHYLRAIDKRTGHQQLTEDDLRFEFMLNALRLVEGFDSVLFQQRTGLLSRCLVEGLTKADQQGWLKPGWLDREQGSTLKQDDIPGRIQLSDEGLLMLNEVITCFS